MITRATSALKLPYKHTISDLPTHVWYLPSVGWNPATNQQKPAAQSQVPLILCHRVKICKIRVSWVLSQIRRVISELTWHLKKPLRCTRWAMVIVSIFHWMREIRHLRWDSQMSQPPVTVKSESKLWQVVKAVLHKAASTRAWIVQSYSPNGAYVHPSLIHGSSQGPTRVCPLTASWSVRPNLQGSPVCRTHRQTDSQTTEREALTTIASIYAIHATLTDPPHHVGKGQASFFGPRAKAVARWAEARGPKPLKGFFLAF